MDRKPAQEIVKEHTGKMPGIEIAIELKAAGHAITDSCDALVTAGYTAEVKDDCELYVSDQPNENSDISIESLPCLGWEVNEQY